MTVFRDISFLWSMMHIILFFLLLFEPRFSWRTTFAVSFAGGGTLLIANVMAMLWLGHGIIMRLAFFTCTIPSFFLFYILSRYRDGRFFFLFCLSDTSCFWILQITNFLDRMTGDTYLVMLIGRLLLFPAAELWIWKYIRRPYLSLQNELTRGWWLFAAVGVTYYLLIMVTSVPVGYAMPDATGLFRIILVLILMPLTYLTILLSLWRQMLLYKNTRQIELQRRDYETLRQKMELGRIFRHDLRHHMVALSGILERGDGEGAKRYIRELDSRLDGLSQKDWCANHALNAVLSAYLSQAEQAGCTVNADIRLPKQLPYDEADLCILLANVLENAIHACRAIPDKTRNISVRLELTGSQSLTLSLTNSAPEPVELGKDGLPVRSSQPGDDHGLGLRSVKAIADQYDGLMRCQWAEGQFLLRVVLFSSKESASRTLTPQ
ncbi:MAG: GHKL domain-containing protein [Lachnospiraceae bacterium]|nr:GHKL domain-containing protein [Lachnospiraceae bacterium]